MNKYSLILVILSVVSIYFLTDLATSANPLSGPAVSPHIVISQVQSGGGGAGTFNDEFVEIFNRGAEPIDLNGYRLVYRSATGSNDVMVPFAVWTASTIIPPGGYYLVASTSYDGAVPPNMTYNPSTCQCSMGAAGGGLAIRLGDNNTGAIIDSIGWGTANNIFVEGAVTAAPAANNSQSRKQGGCQDTDNNANDLEPTIPSAPRNASTTASPCSGSGTTLFAAMSSSPNTVSPGGNALLTVTVIPATTPPSTGITVTGNLTQIGGAASQQFFDNGTNGDATAGDNVFSFLAVIPAVTTGGIKNVSGIATDTQQRVVNVNTNITVNAPLPGEDPLLFGNPSNATPDIANENNYLMHKPQYSLSYNRGKATANWVAWRLDSSWIGTTPRQDDFRPDTTLPAGWYQVLDSDYSGSGYQRGHMCPSGDRTNSVPNNSATFLMTNMVPQIAENNTGPWEDFESYCRTLASQGNEIYIFTGPAGNIGTIAQGKVTVPASTWKVVIVMPNGSEDLSRVNKGTRAFGIIVPNQLPLDVNAPWRNFRVTVNTVENLTGHDFFNAIPKNTQELIEEGATLFSISASNYPTGLDPTPRSKMRIFSVFACLLFLVSFTHAQKDMTIVQVQGEGNTSSAVDQNVRLTGVVTARTKTGFFIQTPDDKADANKNTSEAIFVFTRIEPPVEADNGNIVSVTGTVEEFRRDSDTLATTITELSMRKDRDVIKIVSKANALPKPIVLTAADFMSNSVDSLEKYEGMRVQIDEMTASAPTGGRVDIKTFSSVSDRSFFAVIKPVPRPFREAGRDVRELPTTADKDRFKKEFPKAAIFDSNPDVIRIDCDEQMPSLTQKISPNRCEASAGADVKNVIGVLHYSYGKFTVLTDPDSQIAISAPKKPLELPAPTDRQFIVAGMNLENFFDDEDDPDIKEDVSTPEAFARRLSKISRAIREFMQSPDVIGVIEAENLAALKRLAAKLNADTVAAGKPDPKYEAFLIDGNDGRGIDNGFLVKTARVKVIETKQFGKGDKYKNPNTKEDNFLNDRPPLMIRASINDSKTGQPFEFTAFVNHLKSFLGYNDPKQMDNVRLKKKLQAEFLARFIQSRQTANPKERIIVLGDFNSFQFGDGVMDQIGTITGKPAGKDEVLIASDDLVNPDLINLVGAIAPPQRYSYIFDGNSQVLDHILISETLRKHTTGFGYARINADHPEILRNDPTRFERFSDHDPAIAFFTMDDLTTARGQ